MRHYDTKWYIDTRLIVKHTISPNDIFKSTDEVTWRDVNGELVVLKLTSGEYFSFNAIGRLTWMNLSEGKSIGLISHLTPVVR